MADRWSEEHRAAREALRARGLRTTPIRLDVLAALGAARAPIAAQELTRRLSTRDADRVTVYRTLNTLVEAGLAHRMDPGDRIFRFALAAPLQARAAPEAGAEVPHEAPGGHGHPHLVCDSCGTVECVSDAEVVVHRRTPAKRPRDEGAGFKVKQQEVILHGTCGECAASDVAGDLPAAAPDRGRGPRKKSRS